LIIFLLENLSTVFCLAIEVDRVSEEKDSFATPSFADAIGRTGMPCCFMFQNVMQTHGVGSFLILLDELHDSFLGEMRHAGRNVPIGNILFLSSDGIIYLFTLISPQVR
jgi:hypothetical protein